VSSEVKIPAVDIQIDALMTDEVSRVDWNQVSEDEAVGFGLALSFYRDTAHAHRERRIAWGTAAGSVISMVALTLACLVAHRSPWFALGLVAVTQGLRASWLYWKAFQAAQDVRVMESQAVAVARELAAAHPAKGPDTYDSGSPFPEAG